MPPKASKRVNKRARTSNCTQEFTVSCKILTLPQELFEAIMCYISEDKDSLKPCTLVHSSWRAVSQRLLFHSVVLEAVPYKTALPANARRTRSEAKKPSLKAHPCSRLYDVLVSAPHLARCVRNLEIWEGRIAIDGHDLFRQGEGHVWISGEQSLPKVLGLLEGLQSITLADNNFFPGIVWPRLPVNLRMALKEVFVRPSLKSVSMQFNEDMPPKDFFTHCRKLRHVRLNAEDMDLDEMAMKNAPYRTADEDPIALESLDLFITEESIIPVVDWLLNPLCVLELSQVHKLKIDLSDEFYDEDFVEHARALKLIERANLSLECLGFKPQTYYLASLDNARLDPFTIDNCPRLRKLVLEIPFHCFDDAQFSLEWIRHFISRIGPRQALQEIVIILDIDLDYLMALLVLPPDDPSAPPPANFRAIGEELLKAPLPLLQRFEFAICNIEGGSTSMDGSVQMLSNFLEDTMPQNFLERSIMQVTLLSVPGSDEFLWKYPM